MSCDRVFTVRATATIDRKGPARIKGLRIFPKELEVLAQNLKRSHLELQSLCRFYLESGKKSCWEVAFARLGRPFVWATAIKVPLCF